MEKVFIAYAPLILLALIVSGCGGSSSTDTGDQVPDADSPGMADPSTNPTPESNPVPESSPTPDSSPDSDPVTGTPSETSLETLDTSYEDILTSLAGYQLQSLASDVRSVVEIAMTTAIGSTELEDGAYSVEDQDQNLTLPVSRVAYMCELGGEVVVENTQLSIEETEYSRNSQYQRYVFDQCRLQAQGGQTLQGSLQTLANSISGRHFTLRQQQVNWTAFSWVQEGGFAKNADATLAIDAFDSFSSDQSREVIINRFSHTQSSSTVENLENVHFNQSTAISASGLEQEYTLNAQGRRTDTSGVGVTVTTDPVFYRQLSTGSSVIPSVPFSGQVTFTADDGSKLEAIANDMNGDPGLFVDWVYQDSSGQTRSMTGQPFVDLPFSAQ